MISIPAPALSGGSVANLSELLNLSCWQTNGLSTKENEKMCMIDGCETSDIFSSACKKAAKIHYCGESLDSFTIVDIATNTEAE